MKQNGSFASGFNTPLLKSRGSALFDEEQAPTLGVILSDREFYTGEPFLLAIHHSASSSHPLTPPSSPIHNRCHPLGINQPSS